MALDLIKSAASVGSWLKGAQPLQRLSDGSGLYLLAPAAGGSPAWRLDFTFEAKRKTLSLGTYPETGLALAREKAAAARSLLAAGQNPSQARKDERRKHLEAVEATKLQVDGEPLHGSFEEVARRWYANLEHTWAESYRSKILRRLEMYAFPRIGGLSIDEINPPKIVEMCRLTQSGGSLETGLRVLKLCATIFNYAIAEGTRTSANPCSGVRGALKTPERRNFAAITDPAKLAPLLRAIHGYDGSLVVRSALQLAPLLMVRPGELRQALWEDFDLDNGMWRLPVKRLKATTEEKRTQGEKYHFVPLATQAVSILENLFLLTGASKIVFEGVGRKHRFMSDGTVNAALRAMGYEQSVVTGHGFRATARTILEEVLGYPGHVADMQLAHLVKDPNGSAYNRTQFIDQRRAMMQAWADYLEDLRVDRDTSGKHAVMPAFKPVTARLQA